VNKLIAIIVYNHYQASEIGSFLLADWLEVTEEGYHQFHIGHFLAYVYGAIKLAPTVSTMPKSPTPPEVNVQETNSMVEHAIVHKEIPQEMLDATIEHGELPLEFENAQEDDFPP
jgi:hypothetical protein